MCWWSSGERSQPPQALSLQGITPEPNQPRIGESGQIGQRLDFCVHATEETSVKSPSISAKKPKPFTVSKVKVDLTAFLKATGKSLINLAAAKPVESAAEIPEIVAALGFAKSDEVIAWKLVFRGYQRSICAILFDYFATEPNPIDALKLISWDSISIEDVELEITPEFISSPAKSSIAAELATITESWLSSIGIDPTDAKNLSNRLPGTLALGIHNEWRSDPSKYKDVTDALNSPFLPSVQKELDWSRYSAVVRASVDEPIFEESFSLRQIYVPGRAYYQVERVRPGKGDPSASEAAFDTVSFKKNRVVWLAQEINDWIRKRDKNSAVRLLSGGPGSGKSSFAKIIGAAISELEELRVLFVPLHLIEFDKGLHRSIGEFFASAEYFSENPLDDASEQKPILLILDGLDELQMQGKAAQSIADQLVRDVDRLLSNMNVAGCRIISLITGRELSVQAAEMMFKGEGEVLHLVPYFEGNREELIWEDPDRILAVDQRNDWWINYGKLTSQSFDQIPERLTRGELGDVTAQPLLNYLVALSYRRGGITLDERTNINSVYEDLLAAVYERGWANSTHPSVQGVEYSNFTRLLEEVALSVWHGAGRTTTLREVEDRCKESKVDAFLPSFEAGASSGVSNLLLAFYFRQKGRRDGGDKTFEFTHKTFAEYLISLRVMRSAHQIARKIAAFNEDPDEGWDYKEALYRWALVCGKTRMDTYVLSFIRREMIFRGGVYAGEVQKAFSSLWSYALTHGWPMDRLKLLTFKAQSEYARNAEEALVACLNASATTTGQVSTVDWPSQTSAGEMIMRIQGQRRGPANGLIMDCLSRLDLSRCCLDIADLYAADLSYSNLQGAELHYTNMAMANLYGTDFRDARFMSTTLSSSRVNGAIFSNSMWSADNRGALIIEDNDRVTAQKQRKIKAELEHHGAMFMD